jgi:hypothetical protein
MDIKQSLQSIKNIYMSDNSLSMLCDFERVLDSVDIYAFPNWSKGELVEGPKITKYFVRCKFMWPAKMMPDPNGGKRLLPYGVMISYEKKNIKIPVEIKSSDDYRPNSKKGKLVDTPVWIVEIMMPKHLMKDIKQGSKEIAGEEIDLNDLAQAYEEDLEQKAMIAPGGAPNMGGQAAGGGGAAPGIPNAPMSMPGVGPI